MPIESGTTNYSERIKGTPQNYNYSVRFDCTDGYVGITQYEGDTVSSRVLLSPAQLRALTWWVQTCRAR